MGVYSTNRSTTFGGIDPDTIVANENYSGAGAAELVLVENYQNDMAMFEAILSNDFAQAIAVNEGTILESELTAITEGTLGDFFDKIKEGLKKVWEKIKGIFHAFMVKLSNTVIRDNKKFVEKYKNEVYKKEKLNKLKYKWAEPKSSAEIGYLTAEAATNKIDNEIASTTNLDALAEEVDSDEFVEEVLGATIGENSISASEYAKAVHEHLFDDEEEVEGLDTARLNFIVDVLIKGDKVLSDLQKASKKIDTAFNKRLTAIDKLRNNIAKEQPGKEGESDADKAARDNAMKGANIAYKATSVFQTVATKASGAEIEAVKFLIKECRAVFAKAAAFNPNSIKENAILEEAAYEAAAWDVESLF